MNRSPLPGAAGLNIKWTIGNTIIWALWPWIGALAGGALWLLHDSRAVYIPWQIDQFYAQNSVVIALTLQALLFGTILGRFQQPILSNWIAVPVKRWTFATIAGSFLYSAIPILASPVAQQAVIAYPIYIMACSALGVTQWVVLRRVLSRAGWWIAASTIVLVLPAFIPRLLTGGQPNVLALAASYLAIGLLYSAATLAALRIISPPIRSQSLEQS
jgi:hypothetical protein